MKSIAETMTEKRLIAILRGIPENMLCDVLEMLYEGGVRMAEITFDTSGRISPESTAKMIGNAADNMNDRMHIGAGTVTNMRQLELTKSVGGEFIISPNTDTKIIEATKKLELISIPGAMTVSEIFNASAAGADYVKVFPAGVFGPGYIRQVLAPLNNVKLLAVGGVTPESIPEYLAAGAAGFGIGSAIANAKFCESGSLEKIYENAKLYAGLCEKK